MESKIKTTVILTNNPIGVEAYLRTKYSLNREDYLGIQVCSLRNFCEKMLLSNMLNQNKNVVSPIEQYQFVIEILGDLKKDNKIKFFTEVKDSLGFPGSILKFINDVKLSGKSYGDLKKVKGEKWSDLANILSEYEKILKKEKKLDYSDLLKMCIDKEMKLDSVVEYLFDNPSFKFELENKFIEKIGAKEFKPENGFKKIQRKDYFFKKDNTDEELREVLRDIVFNGDCSFSEVNIVLPKYSSRIIEVYNALERYNIPSVYLKGLPISVNSFGRFVHQVFEYLEDNRNPMNFIKIFESKFMNFLNLLSLGKEEKNKIRKYQMLSFLKKNIHAGGIKNWIEVLEEQRKVIEVDSKENKNNQEYLNKKLVLENLVTVLDVLNKYFVKEIEEISLKDLSENIWELFKKYIKGRCQADNEIKLKAFDVLSEFSRYSNVKKKYSYSDAVRIIYEKVKNINITGHAPEGKSLLVSDMETSAYLVSKRKYIIGLNSNTIPKKYRGLILISQNEMTTLDISEPDQKSFTANEKKCFENCIDNARDKLVLSYYKIDPTTGREYFPSKFMLDLCRNEDNIQKELGIDKEKHLKIADFEEAILEESAKDNISKVLSSYPHLKDGGINALINRHEMNEYTEWDGRITDKDLKQKLGWGIKEEGKTNYLSNSKLTSYLTCPFKYFINYILGIKEREEFKLFPDDWPDSLLRGNIYHQIYSQFFEEIREKKKFPLKENDNKSVERLQKIAQEAFNEFCKTNKPPNDYLAKLFLEQLKADLNEWFDREVEDQKEWTPIYFELPFGYKYKDNADSEYPEPIQLKLKVNGEEVPVSAYLDRIDKHRKERGLFRITDYKSGGSIKNYKYNDLTNSNSFQLILYSELFKRAGIIKDIKKVYLRYYASTFKGNFEEAKIEAGEYDFNNNLKEPYLDLIASSIKDGIFVLNPGGDKTCTKFHKNCPYIGICGDFRYKFYGHKFHEKNKEILSKIKGILEHE